MAGSISRSGFGGRSRAADRLVALIAAGLIFAGIAMMLATALVIGRGWLHQRTLDHAWAQQVHNPAAAAALGPVDGVDFAIRIPALGYYAAVAEGVDTQTLYGGPGHYPSTVLPGQQGTVGVAAHNTYWIQFGELRPGSRIELETRSGTRQYALTGTRVVEATDRTVLVQRPGYHLVLTTCWPLWAGAFATQRYVITADEVRPLSPAS